MTLRRFPVAALLAGALLVPAGPALAFDSIDDLPEPTAKQLAASVRQWDLAGSVRQWDPEGSVRSFADEADESSWTLATDVLFRVDSFDLPESAPEHLSDLLADVPEGSRLSVEGHTDSVVGAIDNKELSEKRADAVAAAIADIRPDLELKAAGYGAERPAVQEKEGDPSTFAANRRVEIHAGE